MNFPIIETKYQFECSKCGNCCHGDQKVNLNPYDLYKICRFKKVNHTKELFEKKWVHLVKSQNNAWLAQIKFKTISKHKIKFCPFLINEFDEKDRLLGLCSLHPDFKPLICSMAPVGRVLDFKESDEHFLFVKPAPDCPGVDRPKINDINDLKRQFACELNHEKEFLNELDSLQTGRFSKRYYLERFYLFPVGEHFGGEMK